MDIKQLKKEIKQLEEDLLSVINAKIAIFETKTDVGISNIDIKLTEMTTIGDKNRKHFVSDVKCSVNF